MLNRRSFLINVICFLSIIFVNPFSFMNKEKEYVDVNIGRVGTSQMFSVLKGTNVKKLIKDKFGVNIHDIENFSDNALDKHERIINSFKGFIFPTIVLRRNKYMSLIIYRR